MGNNKNSMPYHDRSDMTSIPAMNNSNNSIIDKEEEQSRLLRCYIALVVSIIRKHWLLYSLLFALLFFSVLSLFLIVHANSQVIYKSRAALLFSPLNNKEVRDIDIDRVKTLFSTRQVLEKVKSKLSLSKEEEYSLRQRIEISSERKKDHLIFFDVQAPTAQKAIDLANVTANACLEIFYQHRNSEIDYALNILISREKYLRKVKKEIQSAIFSLATKIGSNSPKAEHERLQEILDSLLKADSDLNVQQINAQTTIEKQSQLLSPQDAIIYIYSNIAQEFEKNIIATHIELQDALQLYTVHNPKVITLNLQLEKIVKNRTDFGIKHGLVDYNFPPVENIVLIGDTLKEERHKLEQVNNVRLASQKEIANIRGALEIINHSLPQYDELIIRKENKVSMLKALKEKMALIASLKLKSASEISQLEPSVNAHGDPLLTKKKIAFSIVIAMLLLGGLSFIIISYEIIYGTTQTNDDFMIYDNIPFNGSCPENASKIDEKKYRENVKEIYYSLKQTLSNQQVFLISYLDKLSYNKKFNDIMSYFFAMDGTKIFNITLSSNAKKLESLKFDETSELLGIQKSLNNGYFLLDNIASLSTTEMNILSADVQILLESYDLILIRKDKSIFNQFFFKSMMDICDGALCLFYLNKTKRSHLRFLTKFQKKSAKNISTIFFK